VSGQALLFSGTELPRNPLAVAVSRR